MVYQVIRSKITRQFLGIYIRRLVNISLLEGHFPIIWMIGKLPPLFKQSIRKSGTHSDIRNILKKC